MQFPDEKFHFHSCSRFKVFGNLCNEMHLGIQYISINLRCAV